MKRTIIAGFILILLVFTAGFYLGKNTKNDKAKSFPSTIPSVLSAAPVNVYKDDSGRQHYVFNQATNNYIKHEALKNASIIKPYIDSLASGLDVKPKQIEASLNVFTITKADSVPFYKKQIDSLKRMVLNYKDKYLSLTVRPGSIEDTLDKGSFDFAYNAELSISQYYKRKQFLGLPLGAKESFADISSNDPRTTIMGVKKFTIKQRLPGYGLRLQALSSYNFKTGVISPGIGVRYDIDKWSLLGAYYYNTTIAEWQPIVNVRYDILKF